MARSELVSYIKDNLNKGKDVMFIRSHLISQGISSTDIDIAFDEAYGNKHDLINPKTRRFIGLTLILLIILFIGVGVKIYSSLSTSLDVPEPNPNVGPVVAQTEVFEQSPIVCNYEDDGDKYNCFKEKFKSNDLDCDDLLDVEEKEFCYTAKDFYVMDEV